MKLHRNAKLGLAGRYALVQTIEQGVSLKAAAAAFSVSAATACRWHTRWREASSDERRTLACLHDRSSRPQRMPRLLPVGEQRRICAGQAPHRLGPAAVDAVGRAPAFDDLEGAAPARAVASSQAGTRA